MTHGNNFFDRSVNIWKWVIKIKKIRNSLGDNYTTGSLLDYPYHSNTTKLLQ